MKKIYTSKSCFSSEILRHLKEKGKKKKNPKPAPSQHNFDSSKMHTKLFLQNLPYLSIILPRRKCTQKIIKFSPSEHNFVERKNIYNFCPVWTEKIITSVLSGLTEKRKGKNKSTENVWRGKDADMGRGHIIIIYLCT